MRVLLLNSILRTAENGVIPPANTIKDSMIYNLGMGFKRTGHEVTLIAGKDFKPVVKEDYDFEVIFQKTYWKRVFWPGVLPLQFGLISYLIKNKKKFDLVISSEVFAIPSLFAVMIAPKKTVIWHEVNVHPKLYKKIPSKIWYNIIAKLFFQRSLVVPRSKDAGRFVSQYVRYISETIVEHGVNLENFICSSEKKNQFIVVSQLVKRKNIESIIEKFNAFIQKYNKKDFQLLIAGKGDLQEELQQQILNLNIQNNVTLLGHVPHSELGIILSESMVMLINTKQDLNMVSIPEAIVSGTPVITNLVPTTASFIHENKLGIAKNEWNEDDLYDFFQNKELYIQSCIDQRHHLSVEHSAELLINNFKDFKLSGKRGNKRTSFQ